MGRSFTTSVQSATTPSFEPVKTEKIVCPYPTWSPGLFDPDSDEFFVDVVDERRLDPIPAPLSPVDSASTSSDSSGSELPPLPTREESLRSFEILIRARADVEGLTWLAQVPSNAHDVHDVPRTQTDASVVNASAAARTRSISDATNERRISDRGAPAHTYTHSPARTAEELRQPVVALEQPPRPATPPMLARTMVPVTPPREVAELPPFTPTSETYTISPPPSVTPRVLTYERAARHPYPPVPQSPTLFNTSRRSHMPRTPALPAF